MNRCICPVGLINSDCPVHGRRLRHAKQQTERDQIIEQLEAMTARAEVAEAALREAKERTPLCAVCGKPASCFGEYETRDGKPNYACDACCGHGNEDGWCMPLSEIPEKWAKGEVLFEEAQVAQESAEAALAAMTQKSDRIESERDSWRRTAERLEGEKHTAEAQVAALEGRVNVALADCSQLRHECEQGGWPTRVGAVLTRVLQTLRSTNPPTDREPKA